jgi:hypothetical protein
MTNRTRDVLNLIEDAGRDFPLEIVERVEKNGRILVELRAGNGAVRQFSVSNTSRNDVRGDLNEKARMKRFARDNAPRTEPPASAEAVASPVTTKPEPAQIVVPKTRATLTMKNAPKTAHATTEHAPSRTLDMSAKSAPATESTPASRELTPKEFYKLCSYITDYEGPDAHDDIDVFAMVCTRWLGQSVSVEAVREALDATGVAEPKHWTKQDDPHIVVARELATIMRELGREPSPQFARFLKSIDTAAV